MTMLPATGVSENRILKSQILSNGLLGVSMNNSHTDEKNKIRFLLSLNLHVVSQKDFGDQQQSNCKLLIIWGR